MIDKTGARDTDTAALKGDLPATECRYGEPLPP
jgi:hypothetical protein